MHNTAHNIRVLRKEKNMTQEDLASALHVTRQAVSSWERGGSCPDFDTLKLRADVLEATPEQLLYGEQAEKKVHRRKVGYFLPVLVCLVGAILSMAIFHLAGLLFFIVLLIPICTCAVIDEVRNSEYYRQHPDGYYDEDE